MVQWLGLSTFTAGARVQSLVGGTKMPQVAWSGQKKKKVISSIYTSVTNTFHKIIFRKLNLVLSSLTFITNGATCHLILCSLNVSVFPGIWEGKRKKGIINYTHSISNSLRTKLRDTRKKPKGKEKRRRDWKRHCMGFPGGAVVENLPANAGDTGSSPGPGRSHMPWSNWGREPQLLSLRVWSLCSATDRKSVV